MRACHLRFQLQNSDFNDPITINFKTINNFHGRFHWHLSKRSKDGKPCITTSHRATKSRIHVPSFLPLEIQNDPEWSRLVSSHSPNPRKHQADKEESREGCTIHLMKRWSLWLRPAAWPIVSCRSVESQGPWCVYFRSYNEWQCRPGTSTESYFAVRGDTQYPARSHTENRRLTR